MSQNTGPLYGGSNAGTSSMQLPVSPKSASGSLMLPALKPEMQDRNSDTFRGLLRRLAAVYERQNAEMVVLRSELKRRAGSLTSTTSREAVRGLGSISSVKSSHSYSGKSLPQVKFVPDHHEHHTRFADSASEEEEPQVASRVCSAPSGRNTTEDEQQAGSRAGSAASGRNASEEEHPPIHATSGHITDISEDEKGPPTPVDVQWELPDMGARSGSDVPKERQSDEEIAIASETLGASDYGAPSLESDDEDALFAAEDLEDAEECRFRPMETWAQAASTRPSNKPPSRSWAGDWTNSNPMESFRPGSQQAARVEGCLGRCCRRFITYPGSRINIAHELLGAFLITYDLFVLPLQVFHLPASDFLEVMDRATMIFWTANIFASCMVGYVADGTVIMRPLRILVHYAKTWMLMDILVIIPDWVNLIIGDDKSDSSASVKAIRVVRLIRMVRLLRMVKLHNVLMKVNDMIYSESVSIIANIVKMIALLMVINHFIGCAWFFIGDNQADDIPVWIDEPTIRNAHWVYQYTSAYHWALTQFTPATMDVHPNCILERVFAIAVVLFALVGFSYVVGSITGSLTQLRVMSEEKTKAFWMLRRWLKQHKVPMHLAYRVQKYLEHAWNSRHQKLAIKDVVLFGLLTDQLTHELNYEVALPYLKMTPFMAQVQETHRLTLVRIANYAIVQKPLTSQAQLFVPGESATATYIVIQGLISYTRPDESITIMPGALSSEVIDATTSWLAEPALWTHDWVHVGSAVAYSDSELYWVDPHHFCQVVRKNPQAFQLAKEYAWSFLSWLDSVDVDDLSDVFDVNVVRDAVGYTPQAHNNSGTHKTGMVQGIRQSIQEHRRVSRGGHQPEEPAPET